MALFNKKTKDEKETEKVPEPSMKDLYSDTDKTSLKKVTKDNKKKEISTKKISSKNNSAYKVLIKPLVTEKAANLASKGQYVFVVSREANKIEIMKAIYSVYNIKPLSVNIINNQGKKVRRGKQTGKRKDWKKAIVSLAEGKSLNIYEGV